jgi:alanine racemase
MITSLKCILEIDLDALAKNYNFIKKTCNNSIVGAVVKSNAYGLGATWVAKKLSSTGCNDFFVMTIEEGIEIRKTLGTKGNIYVLHGTSVNDVVSFDEYNLTPVINNLGQLEIWQKLSLSLQKNLPFVLHCDIGINRLGMNKTEFKKLVANPDLYKNLNQKFIMSHLSSSDEMTNKVNESQLQLFKELSEHFPKVKRSLANSSAIFLGKDYHFDLIRPGAAIYGLNPTSNLKSNPMYNIIKLTAPIIHINKIASGETVGYNGTFVAKEETVIATLPIGYADGYSRSLSNQGIVYINNKKAPVVGRISMDLVTIDVSDFSDHEIYLGQTVEIIGANNPPDKIAKLFGTIGYEILTKLGNRFERIYNKA